MPQVQVLSPRPKNDSDRKVAVFCFCEQSRAALGIIAEARLADDEARREWRSGQNSEALQAVMNFGHRKREDAAGSRSRLPPRSVLLCSAQRCPPDTRTLSPRPKKDSDRKVAVFFYLRAKSIPLEFFNQKLNSFQKTSYCFSAQYKLLYYQADQ